MNKLFITLKPLTPFFFGGENTFGDGKINYYARSNYLPQQTTLLGLIRYELLHQNELTGTDPIQNNWASLIGANSFGEINGTLTEDFGAIKKISPIFLTNGSQYFTTQAMDWAFHEVVPNAGNHFTECKKKATPLVVDFSDPTDEFVVYEEEVSPVPELIAGGKIFDPKYGLVSLWVDSSGNRLRQWDHVNEDDFCSEIGFENGFFIKHEQVGIHRNLNRRREDVGDFYKQISFSLIENYSFGFFLDLDLPAGKSFGSRIVSIGGERSLFYMDAADANGKSFETIFNTTTFTNCHLRKHPVVILTSDCYCNNDILDYCLFSINYTNNFQNIITHQRADVNYAEFKTDKIHKSNKNLTLLKRGTVLYPIEGKISELKTSIKNDAFSLIGYNNYMLIN